MKKTQITLLFVMTWVVGIIQAQDSTHVITSAMCNSCKFRLETRLGKIKGIQKAELDVSSKNLLVFYDRKLISPQVIEAKVTEIGYDANGRPAKKSAYKRLPACCRKDYQGTH